MKIPEFNKKKSTQKLNKRKGAKMSHDSGERRQFIDLEKKALVRYVLRNQKFEIIVDPELALDYKKGKEIPLSDIVESFIVFHNASKGAKASETILEQIFETDNSDGDQQRIRDYIIYKSCLYTAYYNDFGIFYDLWPDTEISVTEKIYAVFGLFFNFCYSFCLYFQNNLF